MITMQKRSLLLFLVMALGACTTIGPAEKNPYLSTKTEEASSGLQSETEDVPEPTATQIPTAEPTPTLAPGPTLTPIPATYFHFEPGVNPLTGLAVPDPGLLNRRPAMVKVSNWPREGRPHAGLTQADFVFEYFIGHQMNRFLAIYYGEDADMIGPVRSGRLVDAQLVSMYQGILGYGNADPQVDEVLLEQLGDRALAFNNVPCPAMCGESTHSATGVFANSGALTEYAVSIGVDNAPPDLRGMYFQPEPPAGDASGLLLEVAYADFSIMAWHYEEKSAGYHLWTETETEAGLDLAPMTDRNNQQPTRFDNVVVMYAEYIEFASSLHDIIIQGITYPQPALLFRDGRVNFATWRVPEPGRPIIFETPGGNPLPFKPGKTWIVIVGLNSVTIQPAGGIWEIAFGLP